MRKPPPGFYYGLAGVPLMYAGDLGADLFQLSYFWKAVTFVVCLCSTFALILLGAVREVRAETGSKTERGYLRRMISLYGMLACGLGFSGFAAAYFWPSENSKGLSQNLSEAEAPLLSAVFGDTARIPMVPTAYSTVNGSNPFALTILMASLKARGVPRFVRHGDTPPVVSVILVNKGSVPLRSATVYVNCTCKIIPRFKPINVFSDTQFNFSLTLNPLADLGEASASSVEFETKDDTPCFLTVAVRGDQIKPVVFVVLARFITPPS